MLGFSAIAERAIAEAPIKIESPAIEYARAPAGAGYTPRRVVHSTRPPAVQETIR